MAAACLRFGAKKEQLTRQLCSCSASRGKAFAGVVLRTEANNICVGCKGGCAEARCGGDLVHLAADGAVPGVYPEDGEEVGCSHSSPHPESF